MASQLNLSGQAKVSYVPNPGGVVQDILVVISGTYTTRSDDRYDLVNSGTKVVDFGGVAAAGAKLVLVHYEAGATPTSPIQLDVGTDLLELTPGGFFFLYNPSPTDGMDALSIAHVAAATVRVVVLG